MIDAGIVWVSVYVFLVIVHMVIASLTLPKEKETRTDEPMLWILCFIPLTWLMYWIAGIFWIKEKIKDNKNG